MISTENFWLGWAGQSLRLWDCVFMRLFRGLYE